MSYSYQSSHRISSSYQGTFGRPRQQQSSSYENHSYHQQGPPPAEQLWYGQDQPASYEHEMYRQEETSSSRGARPSRQEQASYVQQLYRQDDGANAPQMYSHHEASYRQQSSSRRQQASYVQQTTCLSQNFSEQRGRDLSFETETRVSHAQRRSGPARSSRETHTREATARSLGLPVRHAYRSGTVREYPLPAEDYDDVDEIEYEDYPSSSGSPQGRGAIVSDRASAQGVRSRSQNRRPSFKSGSTSKAVVKHDRGSQDVNASGAADRPTWRTAADTEASHDEDSGDDDDDDMAVVQYEKPKSALSSKAKHTPRKNPFHDEKSQRPRWSGLSTAKPTDESNRAAASGNDLQDSRGAMKEQDGRLARDRQSGGISAGTGREPTNRDTEQINGPKKVRFAANSERSPRYTGDHTMSGALPSRLENLSLNDRDSPSSTGRNGPSKSQGTESRPARTGRNESTARKSYRFD